MRVILGYLAHLVSNKFFEIETMSAPTKLFTNLFCEVMRLKKMSDKWRRTLVLVYKNKYIKLSKLQIYEIIKNNDEREINKKLKNNDIKKNTKLLRVNYGNNLIL